MTTPLEWARAEGFGYLVRSVVAVVASALVCLYGAYRIMLPPYPDSIGGYLPTAALVLVAFALTYYALYSFGSYLHT